MLIQFMFGILVSENPRIWNDAILLAYMLRMRYA